MKANIARQRLIRKAIFIMAVLSVSSRACVIPVFRYALERWQSDFYETVVLYDSVLTDEDSAKIAEIAALSGQIDSRFPFRITRGESAGNMRLVVINVADSLPKWQQRIVDEHKGASYPWAAAFFPYESGIAQPIWKGPLGDFPGGILVDSPLRREIARRITGGETGVWILVESGNKAENKRAYGNLKKHLKKAAETVKLPEINLDEAPPWYDPEAGPALRIDFSIVVLSRTDPSERLFLEMLLHTEPELMKENKPIAIPVYGRMRALTALVGEKVTEDYVIDICRFMSGPCSCVIKADNPGLDMLCNADWDRRIQPAIKDPELPELTGLSDMMKKAGDWRNDPKDNNAGPSDSALERQKKPPAEKTAAPSKQTPAAEKGSKAVIVSLPPREKQSEKSHLPAHQNTMEEKTEPKFSPPPDSGQGTVGQRVHFAHNAPEEVPTAETKSGSLIIWAIAGSGGAAALLVLAIGFFIFKRKKQ
jgi:hypothetical protein